MSNDSPQVHTEYFNLHLELQRDGGTLAEFETDFANFSWTVPKVVYFSEPMSGFGAHLALNAFETSIRDRGGDVLHLMAGAIGDLHANGSVDLGVHGQIDFRALRISDANLYVGIDGWVTADPATGQASVGFGPALSIQFGATAHPEH